MRAVAVIVLVAVSTLPACAPKRAATAPNAMLRVPAGVPDRFVPEGTAGTRIPEPTGEISCKNPMIDPRTGLRLTLVRSNAGQGDYDVPSGKYGVAADEVLRIDCATGRAVGIFRR